MKNIAPRLVGIAIALGAPVTAWAQQTVPQDLPEAGSETRNWVELQVSNNASMGGARPMSGEVADQVFTRYLKSFSHPIPEYFEREKFVQSGSSGSSSGQ